jgi:hypothetical protein
MNSFNEDLKFGTIYEKKTLDILNISNYEMSKGYQPLYDILDKDKNIKYEVKADRKAYFTNNICIEYNRKDGSPSGIYLTEADYYIYYIIREKEEYDLYIIPTKKIKKYIEKNKYSRIIKASQSFNKCALFKLDVFKKYKN